MKHRLRKIQALAEKIGVDLIIIHAPDNIDYFTGVQSLGDIAALLVFDRKSGFTRLYVPLLEYQRYRDGLPDFVEVVAVSKAIKPEGVPVVDLDWKEIVARHIENVERVGMDLSHSGVLLSQIAETAGSKASNVSENIWNFRMIKEDDEIEAIKKAADITAKGIRAIQSDVREGVTEAELAGLFEYTARKQGAERMAFDPIVAFKPNNAYPHTLPGTRRLGKDDMVLVDVGVKYDGRCSDVTRMILWGRLNQDEKRALDAVVEALRNAIDSVQPGVKACDVYDVAVKTLDKYGLKEKFIHGLGHGFGIVVHEPPYLRHSSTKILEPGMVFTIEPGVYIPGEFGIRVEEDVLVTERGAKVLSSKLELLLEV